MAEKSVDEITNEAIKEGGILALFYFDIHGNSEEGIRNVLVELAGKISKEQGLIYSYAEIDKSIKSDEMYATSAEIKLLVQDFQTLVNLVVLYAPIAIEILRPEDKLELPIGEAQNALISVSSMARTYTQIALDKVLTPEQKADYYKKIQKSGEVGKEMREKKE